ncbi:MAG: hypothetical protein V3V08_13100 [Nannocystaceae bacterium]
MKERDYINATDLAKVRAAESILRDLLPSISIDAITDEDYEQVMKTLYEWRTALFEATTGEEGLT